MAIKVIEIHKDRKYIIRIRPVAYPYLFDRMSCIIEIRDLQGEILEVWHLHVRHKDGKIIHRDRKYP